MPLYTYRCLECEATTDVFRSIARRNETPVCECGGETKKIIPKYAVHSDLRPYFDEHLETHIQSRQHRQKVMKDKGVSEKFGKGWQ